MRRLAIALLLAFGLSIPAAFAGACSTTAACGIDATHSGCAFDTGASWTGTCTGAGGIPAGTDTWTIASGHTVYVVNDPTVCAGGGVINGTLEFDSGTGGRDAAGFRNFNCTAITGDDITIASGGTLRMRRGDRIKYDSSAFDFSILISDGGLLDIQGDIFDTTIGNPSPNGCTGAGAPYPGCTGAGTCGPLGCGLARTTGNGAPCSGLQYVAWLNDPLVLPPSATAATQLIGRRVLFKSGKASTRQYEITAASVVTTLNGVTVPPTAVSVTWCPNLDDTANGLLQRLTPHAAFVANRTKPSSAHNQPAAESNAECTAANTPATLGCCTGNGTGFCVEMAPAAGDAITVIRDVHLVESAGAKGGYIRSDISAGITTPPIIQGLNFAQRDGDAANASHLIQVSAKTNGIVAPPFLYNNLHDHNNAMGVRWSGFQNHIEMWNACHDEQSNAGVAQGCIYPAAEPANFSSCGSGGCPITGLVLSYNEGFRCHGICFATGSDADPLQSYGCALDHNLTFQGCTLGATECNGPEMLDCSTQGLLVSHMTNNVTYDIYSDAGSGLTGPHTGNSVYPGSVLNDNYTVNIQGIGQAQQANDTATRNYVSHTGGQGISRSNTGGGETPSGRLYSNIVRDTELESKGSLLEAIRTPGAMYGNFIEPNDDTTFANATDCAPGTHNKCSKAAVAFFNTTLATPPAVILLDNVMVGLSDTGTNNCGFIGWNCGNASNPNYPITVGHVTFDNRVRDAVNDGRHSVLFADGAGTQPVTVYDIAAKGMHNNWPGIYDANGAAPFTVTNMWVRKTSITGDTIGEPSFAGGNDTNTLYTRVHDLGYYGSAQGNYQLAAGSRLVAGGTNPAGSAVGSRGFLFKRVALSAPWGYGLPFDGEQPADFSNGTCTVILNGVSTVEPCNTDTDGDGVLDIHDNCPTVPNPGQFDTDGNGVGDACDH